MTARRVPFGWGLAFYALVVGIILTQLLITGLAVPQPPEQLNILDSSRKPDPGLISVPALAGNVTRLTINSDQVTKNWQGYYGEVTGRIVLDDADNQSLYAWTLVDPRGEVYATRNATVINWTNTNIVCANLTNSITREEGEMNTNSEVSPPFFQARDGVNETFNLTTHPAFYVSANNFSANECTFSTSLFVSDSDPNGGAVPRSFNETLLYSLSDGALIFTSILEPNALGFNDTPYDFEMLVTEDGHLDDVATTAYFFYVELE